MNQTGRPEDIVAGIARIATALETGIARRVEAASGLTLAQLAFLRCLAADGGALALGGVAERLCCAKSNASQLADRLEAQGLVVREPDPSDGRSVRAVLTEAGRVRLEAGESTRRVAAAELLRDVPAGDLDELVALLGRLHAATGGGDGEE